jgi:pyruvate/2-oxoglutarate dehydrogenase complex dihydrolipoamide acyltransferase (E2) component
MKSLKLIGGMAFALLLTAACSAPAPSNNAAANANAANKNAAPVASATPAATPAANANNANTSSAQEGAAQDFTLVNETGVEIDKVFISPHDKDDWEEDVLGKDTLPSGQNVDIKFHRDETSAEWDLRIEDKDGNAIEWENLNLLKISKVTLHYKDKKATAEVE